MNHDDRELLDQFATNRSEDSFRELLHRHVNLVYSAAVRQTYNHALAEEVTQAVFILLAQKARSLGRNTNVAGWLLRSTHFVASRVLRAEQRRVHREQKAFVMSEIEN